MICPYMKLFILDIYPHCINVCLRLGLLAVMLAVSTGNTHGYKPPVPHNDTQKKKKI